MLEFIKTFFQAAWKESDDIKRVREQLQNHLKQVFNLASNQYSDYESFRLVQFTQNILLKKD